MKQAFSQGDLVFRFTSNRLCLDFLATKGEVGYRNIERIGTPHSYSDWIAASGILEPGHFIDATDVVEAVSFRESLRSYFADVVAGGIPEASTINLINEAARRPVPRMEMRTDGASVTKRADRPGAAVLSSVARDVITLVSEHLLVRVKRCNDPTCNMFFLDNSRGNNRIWCATEGRGCGNKAKKRAFRARQREQA